MTEQEKVRYWMELADYDLNVAESMFKAKHWLYVGFMCHQVIEKTLKAYWTATQETIPPYIHNLARLAHDCKIESEMSEEQLTFIDTLTPLNIEARYPEYKGRLAKILNEVTCRSIINQTKELQQWIKTKL